MTIWGSFDEGKMAGAFRVSHFPHVISLEIPKIQLFGHYSATIRPDSAAESGGGGVANRTL